VDGHYPEEIWESYAMGVLSEEQSAPLEEHLLVCPACQDLLAELDEYLEAMRAAARRCLSKSVAASGTLR
jgi:anti-sigma factor RsiW